MKYDIYFHNDFDGRASAAVMLAFLRSRGDDIEHYIAMTYGNEKEWLKEGSFEKKNPAIVVDFTYHPKATWWFDHHASAFKDPAWKEKFRPDKQHHLDPSYRSCCHLVYSALRHEFQWKSPKHLAELVKWLDIVDGAGYRSAKQTIEMREPAIQMNSYIEALHHNQKEDVMMIQLLAEKPIADVIKAPAIAKAIKKLKANVAKSVAFYKKNLQVFRKSTFIDVTADPLNGLLRSVPYHLYPEIVYGVRMKKKGKWWYLGVGANPWRRSGNKLNIGTLMKQYHGGGHKDVGATEFASKAEALKAFQEINVVLNH